MLPFLQTGKIRKYFGKAPNIAVFGDIILDAYQPCRVERINKDDPLSALVDIDPSQHKRTYSLGGAANVAHGIRALGGRVLLCGVLGYD